MRRPKLVTFFLIAAVAIFSSAFACGKSDPPSTPANSGSANTAGPSNSSDAAPAPAAPKNLTGTYEVTGTNEGGGGNYKGLLEVIGRGDVYQFRWDTGKKYDGVGVQTDNSVAVAYAEGDDGTGCGVVLYKVGADGSLDGKAGYWGENTAESEKGTRTSGSGIDGEYAITGKTPDGKDYKGTLTVKAEGSGYTFKWNTGATLEGFGVKQGDKLAVGFGGKKCGFVAYDVASDGNMTGKWGGWGTTEVGTETAKKK